MEKSLRKQAKNGDIDFVIVPLLWGSKHKEFLIYSKKYKEFSAIFYDNKYRQNRLNEDTLAEYKKRSGIAEEFINRYQ